MKRDWTSESLRAAFERDGYIGGLTTYGDALYVWRACEGLGARIENPLGGVWQVVPSAAVPRGR